MKLPKLSLHVQHDSAARQPSFQGNVAPQGLCQTLCQVAHTVCKSQGGGALCDIGLAACLEAC